MSLRSMMLMLALGCSVSAEDVWLPHPSADSPERKLAQLLRAERVRPATTARSALLQSGAAADQVRVRLDVPVTAANIAAIAATGAVVVTTSERWHEVIADATAEQLGALAGLTAVAQIKPLLKPLRQAAIGTFNDGADAVLGIAGVRTTYGVDGTGRKIGIISDSINLSSAVGSGTVTGSEPNATLTGTTPQRGGDLPASIQVIDFGDATDVGDTDEGAAMMELAYHLAPGAGYAFASCGASETVFADNIAKLAAAGCSIICDDIIFLGEPMFQDGPVAQAVDAAAAGGAVYLSSAGNQGDLGILASYHDVSSSTDAHSSGTIPTGADFHDWGIGGLKSGFLPLTITPSSARGGSITVVLQWNQPFASHGLGRGSASDFDLLLFSSNDAPSSTTLLTGSGDSQGTSASPEGDPLEGFAFTTLSTRTVYLALDRFSATAPSTTFRIAIYTSGCDVSLPPTTTGYPAATIYGHAAATGALAIAAVPYGSPTTVEPFTSRGGWGGEGLPFYFSPTGSALSGAPLRRNKPDLAAPDGTPTSLPYFTPFYGTSAAAPHAAAAFAVLWQLTPANSREGLIDLVASTATDLTTAPASGGDDAWSGHGLISASAAASTTPATGPTCALASASSGAAGTALEVTVTFSAPVTGFTASDLIVTNGTVSELTGSEASYVATVLPASPGTLTVLVPAGAARAASDNSATLGALLSVTISAASSGPTCTLSGATNGAMGAPQPITVTFSAPVTGFTAADVRVLNGGVSRLTGGGASYVAMVVPAMAGTMRVTVATGVARAADGGPNQAASFTVAVISGSVLDGGPTTNSSGGCGLGSGLALLGFLPLVGVLLAGRRKAQRA